MEQHPKDEILRLAETACLACGAGDAMARSLARASVSASAMGRHEVGLAHLIDHLNSLNDGRINGAASPIVESPALAMLRVDADAGVAQHGFDLVFDDLVRRAREAGLALLAQRNCYPAGELGYFARRLAQAGLIGLSAGNAHPLMAVAAGGGKVFSTNPMAFAAPLIRGRPPMLFDQASSATAFVNIIRAADAGQGLPEGWALDSAGDPTTDPVAALAGALLPFGGYKGANIALMVEVLAAGLTGGRWSLDAGHFLKGDACPGGGMIVLAIAPSLCAADFSERLTVQLDRLLSLGLSIPGMRYEDDAMVLVSPTVLNKLRCFAAQ